MANRSSESWLVDTQLPLVIADLQFFDGSDDFRKPGADLWRDVALIEY